MSNYQINGIIELVQETMEDAYGKIDLDGTLSIFVTDQDGQEVLKLTRGDPQFESIADLPLASRHTPTIFQPRYSNQRSFHHATRTNDFLTALLGFSDAMKKTRRFANFCLVSTKTGRKHFKCG